MAISAALIVGLALATSIILRKPTAASLSAAPSAEEIPESVPESVPEPVLEPVADTQLTQVPDSNNANADALAHAKIEVLKHRNSKGSSDSKSASGPIYFDVQNAASAALARLVDVRKCERLAGALRPDLKTACPVGHPAALASASGYSDLLVEQTVAELAFLKQLALHARSERQADPYDLAQVARVYVKHSDDNVREQALSIASLMAERDGKEALAIAAFAIRSTVSGPLASQALKLLGQQRTHDPQLVDQAVTQALKTGGWDVRDAVASQLLPFITAETKDEFAKILASEPVRSKIALHIRLNLEEFDRMERL